MSEQVRKFLLAFKLAATSSSGVKLVPRHGTLQTLSFLGLTKKNLEEILLQLSVANYCRGPLPDRNMLGEVWEFGKDIDGYEVYIKLNVASVSSTAIAKCISFHIAKYPLTYPYK